MYEENIEVSWNDFATFAPNAFKQLWNDDNFTDVTLATEDGHQLKVHKAIVSSCSTFFRDVLLKNPHQNTLLYLKDLKLKEVKQVVKFIYIGECQMERKELDAFLVLKGS